MGRRKYDAVHAPVDGVLDDVDLARIVCLLRRPLPHDLDVGLFGSLLRAGMHALPEEVRDAFRDDGDDALPARILPMTGRHKQASYDRG